jgi:hypothetical protein
MSTGRIPASPRPEEVGRYEQLFADRAYLPASFLRPVQETIRHVRSPRRRAAPDLPQLQLAV